MEVLPEGKVTMFANILQGKKTYAAAVTIIGLAVAKHFGIAVPEEVWLILGGLGLGFLRNAVEK